MQTLLLQGGHEQGGIARKGDAGGGDGGRPGPQGWLELWSARLPAHRRPAVVASSDQAVNLVVGVGAVLADVRMAGPWAKVEALRVAVAEREDGARCERVVGGNGPVGVDAEYLAVQRAKVLRERRLAGLAHRNQELAVGSEAHPAAVVDHGASHVIQKNPVPGQACPFEPEPLHAVEHRLSRGTVGVARVYEWLGGGGG